MAASDPPSPKLLATLHYLEDRANFGRSYPKTTSDAVRLVYFFIKRDLGWAVEWPLAQPGGSPGGPIQLEDVAGVTSIRADASPALTGAVVLASGANITLTQVGQTITIDAATVTPGIGAVLFDSTLGADTASIDTGANGIASGYHLIEVHMQLRTTQAIALSSITMRVNGDAGANYDRSEMHVTNATVSGSNTLAATSWAMSCAGANAQAGSATAIMLAMPNYDGTVFHKSCVGHGMVSDSAAASNLTEMRSLRWRSTVAVNQFAVTAGSGNLLAGSRVTILGF